MKVESYRSALFRTRYRSATDRAAVVKKTDALKLCFATDLHLNRANERGRRAFYRKLTSNNPDLVVITGDISEGRLLPFHLRELAQACAPRPIYFVLGNHDFYGSSFVQIDRVVSRVCHEHENLHHLGHGEIIPLTREDALVGHRGWADGRAGWGAKTVVPSRDCNGIMDFQGLSKNGVFDRMRELGQASGRYFREVVPAALKRFRHVWVATHVPPFFQAAYFQGRPCGWAHQPHFVNFSAGGVLSGIAAHHPRKQFTILCGHTHSRIIMDIAKNVRIHTGRACSGLPQIDSVFQLN